MPNPDIDPVSDELIAAIRRDFEADMTFEAMSVDVPLALPDTFVLEHDGGEGEYLLATPARRKAGEMLRLLERAVGMAELEILLGPEWVEAARKVIGEVKGKEDRR